MAPTEEMNWGQVANWFFRLNGCLTIPNFIVHGDLNVHQRTDVDILAVRFPNRLETAGEVALRDHKTFENSKWIDLVIAEIKAGLCDLNGPWTDREKGNMNQVLRSIGIVEGDVLDTVANGLYGEGQYMDARLRIRLFALGRNRNHKLLRNAVQITWAEIADFFFDRFLRHGKYKRQHEQWDKTGIALYELSIASKTREDFEIKLLDTMASIGEK